MDYISLTKEKNVMYFFEGKIVSPQEFWSNNFKKRNGQQRFFYEADMSLKKIRELMREIAEKCFFPYEETVSCCVSFFALSGNANINICRYIQRTTATFTCNICDEKSPGYSGILSMSSPHNHAFFRCYGPEKDIERKLLEVFRPEDGLTVDEALEKGRERLRMLRDARF